MAVSEFFSREADGAGSRTSIHGLTRLAVGTVYFITGGIAAWLFLPELEYVVAAVRYGTPSLTGTFDAVRAVVGAAIGLRGARMIAEGAASVRRAALPPSAPADLSPGEAEAALARREPGAFRRESRRRLRFLRKWLPDHEPLLTSRMRVVVDAGLGEIRRFARLVLAVAGGLAVVAAVPSLRQGLFGGVQPGVPGLFLTIYGAAAVLHAWAAIRALPAAAPRAEVREFRGGARGGRDPSLLAHGLRQDLTAIRAADGLPNRAIEDGFTMEGRAGGGGSFEGRLLVETQPRFAAMADAPLAPVLLVAGAAVQVLALPWLLGTPERPQTLTTGAQAGTAATMLFAGQLLAGFLLARLGGRMVASGGELLRGFRFESLAALLHVRGTAPRAGVAAAVGFDSIEPRFAPGEVRVTGHVARLLTESREPLGERVVVGMVADDRAAEVELLVQRFLWRFDRQAALAPEAPGSESGRRRDFRDCGPRERSPS